MATQPGEKLKLETKASTTSIPWTARRDDFAVLVRVTAPPPAAGIPIGGSRPGGGVDLVAVLDIGGSMNEENRLESMKQAMIFVINQLGPDDRLAIVSFNDHVQHRTELSPMSDENRVIARTEVDRLTAGGGTNLSAATEAAAEILGKRGQGDKNNRVGRIIFLGNGDGDANPGQHTSPESAAEAEAEAFALGADENMSPLSYNEGKTSGAYSYVNRDVDQIKDAESITSLTSVDAAIAVQIDLEAHQGVSLTALESGGHRVSVGPDGRGSLTIYIHDLHAGEHKEFIVYLMVPEGKEDLLTVRGWCRDPENSTDDAYTTSRLDDSEVSILRPAGESTPADLTISPEVAAEFARARRPKQRASATAEHPTKVDILHEGRDDIPKLEQVNDQAMKQPVNVNVVPKQGGRDFDGKLSKLETMWGRSSSWLAGTTSSRVLPPCVALILILAAVLPWLRVGGPAAGNTWSKDGKRSSSLGMSLHPGWPKMEKSLHVTMREMMEDIGVTSFLQRAHGEDMRHTMNIYINLALAHASVLGSRCYGPAVVSARGVSVLELEHTVERLETEKEELRFKIEEILAEEKVAEETSTVAAHCAASNEKEEALERANTRIRELERHLQHKEDFAHSLLTEVAKTDAHLKTCGHRVDLLEVKVRELEGADAAGKQARLI